MDDFIYVEYDVMENFFRVSNGFFSCLPFLAFSCLTPPLTHEIRHEKKSKYGQTRKEEVF